MSVWNTLSTIVVTVVLSGFAVVALGCAWPADSLEPSARARPPRVRHRATTVAADTEWTCALPGVPLSIDDAHNAMRRHRGHDCPRKCAAFATLIAHGCLTPDPTRRSYRQKALPGTTSSSPAPDSSACTCAAPYSSAATGSPPSTISAITTARDDLDKWASTTPPSSGATVGRSNAPSPGSRDTDDWSSATNATGICSQPLSTLLPSSFATRKSPHETPSYPLRHLYSLGSYLPGPARTRFIVECRVGRSGERKA